MSSAVYAGPRCPLCRVTLDLDGVSSGLVACPSCRGAFEAVRFTPPSRRTLVARVAEAGPSGASPCGTHPANASETSCERCGVFMCGLCRLDVEGQTLCPSCFERLSSQGRLRSTQATLISYHRIAIVTLLAGVFTWPLMLVFGIAAFYLCLRELRRKRELDEPEGRASVLFTLAVALIETVGGLGLIVYFVSLFQGKG